MYQTMWFCGIESWINSVK